MTILDTSVSVSQVVDWGATQFVSEDLIRRWAQKDELTLREIIDFPNRAESCDLGARPGALHVRGPDARRSTPSLPFVRLFENAISA